MRSLIFALSAVCGAALLISSPQTASDCSPTFEFSLVAPQPDETLPENAHFFVSAYFGSDSLEASIQTAEPVVQPNLQRRSLGSGVVEFYAEQGLPVTNGPFALVVANQGSGVTYNYGDNFSAPDITSPEPPLALDFSIQEHAANSCNPASYQMVVAVTGAPDASLVGYQLLEETDDGMLRSRAFVTGQAADSESLLAIYGEREDFEDVRCFQVVAVDQAGNRSGWDRESSVCLSLNDEPDAGSADVSPNVDTGPTADAGVTADAGSTDAGGQIRGLGGGDVGCGCRSGSAQDSILWPLALLALWFWRTRRRVVAVVAAMSTVFVMAPKAEACSVALFYEAVSPTETSAFPANASYFVSAWMFASEGTEAELHFGDAFAPVPLETHALGLHVMEFTLDDPLPAGSTPEQIAVRSPVFPNDWQYLPINRTVGPVDNTPPSPPNYLITAQTRSPDSCFANMAMVVAEVEPTSDDIVGYELREHVGGDRISVGFSGPADNSKTARIVFLSSPGELQEARCFSVAAVDRAGNRSLILQPPQCVSLVEEMDAGMMPDLGQPDQGEPDLGSMADAGSIDSATPDLGAPDAGTDAGVVVDAGRADSGGGGLSEGETGCGCRSGRPEGSAVWFAAFGLFALWRRRSSLVADRTSRP